MSGATGDVPLDSLEAATGHAWAAYHAGDWPEALRRWNAVGARWPTYAPARVHATAALWEDNQHEASLAAISRAAAEIPSDAQIQTKLAEILSRLGRSDEAGQLLERGVSRFPYNPELAVDYMRMAHVDGDGREVLRRACLVEKTHPDLLVCDGGVYHLVSKARSDLELDGIQGEGLWGDPSLYDPRLLMLSFESLGENCEFGLVQRHFGVEPLGLMRWSATSPGSLIEALEQGFEGVGTAACTRLIEIGTEYATVHRIYGMGSHTFVAVDRDREAEIYEDQLQRLAYLRGKLMEDLEDGGKTFVYHLEVTITPRELRSIHKAIRRYGAVYILYVQKSDDENPACSVRKLDHGAMIGYLSRLGPERRADGDSWDRLVFDEWLTICKKARLLRRADEGHGNDPGFP